MKAHNNPDSAVNLSSHLLELRSRLIKILLVLLLLIAVLTPFLPLLLEVITQPMLKALPAGNKMSITGVLEGVIVPFKILVTVAFVLSLPFTLYQFWAFVAPGLYRRERKIVLPLVFSSLILFFLGMTFCYFIFFPLLFRLAAAFTPASIALYIPTIDNYLAFILTMLVIFGLAFQLPVAMFCTHAAGLITVTKLKNWRGYAVIAAFAVAAVLTPPDIISQFFLAVPLILLYQIGIWACTLNALFTKNKTAEK